VVTKADASMPALGREVAIAYLLTAVALYVVVRGVFVSTRVRHRHIVGVMVTDRDEPALWERVRFLARAVGTRAPSRIYLVPDVNAVVWENARLLGLIPGRRSMMIGMPLLIALTPAQSDAVIAHELGHYGNRDTRLGALDHRARESVMPAVEAAFNFYLDRYVAAGIERDLLPAPGPAGWTTAAS
jgi:Zn-dependent protease with chaperone function